MPEKKPATRYNTICGILMHALASDRLGNLHDADRELDQAITEMIAWSGDIKARITDRRSAQHTQALSKIPPEDRAGVKVTR